MLSELIIEFHGPAATHNQRCAVHHDEHAVLNTNTGVFQPSWKARREGWRLIRVDTWFQRLVMRLVFDAKY